MSLSVAKPAVARARTIPAAVPDRCLMLFAHHAEIPARFLLSPETIVLFIAANVLKATEDNDLLKHPSGCFLFCKQSLRSCLKQDGANIGEGYWKRRPGFEVLIDDQKKTVHIMDSFFFYIAPCSGSTFRKTAGGIRLSHNGYP